MTGFSRKVLLIALAGVATLTMQRYVGQRTIYSPEAEVRRDSMHQFVLENRLPPGRSWSDYGLSGGNVRVLVPYLAEGIHRATSLSVRSAYYWIDTLALFGSLILLFALLRFWADPLGALSGMLYVCAILPLTYLFHYYHPWDRVSFLIWIALVLLLRLGRLVPFAILLVIGVAAKYDVAVMPGLFFLASFERKTAARVVAITGVLSAISLGTYFLLAQLLGGGIGERSIGGQVIHNLQDITSNGIQYPPLLAFGVPAILAAVGFPEADRFARACALFAVVVTIPLFLLTNFIEVRAEMPLLLLLFPGALAGLRRLMPGAEARSA